MAESYPRLYALLLNQTPVELGVAQASLRPDEALVLLIPPTAAAGEQTGVVFVVTSEAASYSVINDLSGSLENQVASVRGMVASNDTSGTRLGHGQPSAPFDRSRAFALYRTLFGNNEAALRGKNRWLLAASGYLATTPFYALVMGEPPGSSATDVSPNSLRATAWLGLRRTLDILPSVSVLRDRAVVFPSRSAATYFGMGYEASGSIPVSDASRYLHGIAAHLGADRDSVVLGGAATETELYRRNIDGRLSAANTVVFDTRCQLTDEAASISNFGLRLALSRDTAEQPTSATDGFLNISEVTSLGLNAQVVVLSACDTLGLSEFESASLSRLEQAFIYAGAKSLLVSNHSATDAIGLRLTTATLQSVHRDGLDLPEALRAAMQSVFEDTSADNSGRSFAHPATWGRYTAVN